MQRDTAIEDIERCSSVGELMTVLQSQIEILGFASFAFMDAGQPDRAEPFSVTTSGAAWDREYRGNQFALVDPCLNVARRTNLPFRWTDIPLPEQKGVRRPAALKTMDAARDHGFEDGLVIPFHYADHLGRQFSSCGVFFWKDRQASLQKLLDEKRIKHDLHLIMLYWAQRVVDLHEKEMRPRTQVVDQDGRHLAKVSLTDRERDVLSWAARGKTVEETALILGVAKDTCVSHMKNAMRKLNVQNKPHAIAVAIYLGVIDL